MPNFKSILPEEEITDSETFREYHNRLLSDYAVEFENDCDLWSAVRGNIYSKDDKFIIKVTGIYYDKTGDWDGDLDGYLRMLEKELFDWYTKIYLKELAK